MKMISLDDIIEYCNNERAAYKANNCGAACTALRRLAEFAKEYAIEAEPVKQDTELSIILQDYGIKDTDTLRYILDQYQKIIVDITGGQMSYLTYPAETVIACADDNYRKCHEESINHGAWDSGYNVALSEIKEKIKQMPTVEVEPCTFCVYNPPSSCDGKPCTMCPAVAKGE